MNNTIYTAHYLNITAVFSTFHEIELFIFYNWWPCAICIVSFCVAIVLWGMVGGENRFKTTPIVEQILCETKILTWNMFANLRLLEILYWQIVCYLLFVFSVNFSVPNRVLLCWIVSFVSRSQLGLPVIVGCTCPPSSALFSLPCSRCCFWTVSLVPFPLFPSALKKLKQIVSTPSPSQKKYNIL